MIPTVSIFCQTLIGALHISAAGVEREFSQLKLIRNDKRKSLDINSS
jgi:hypothetical protein